MKHKWHKEIKAWADGAEIQCKIKDGCIWLPDLCPSWENDTWDFRIKPQQKEPQYLYVYSVDSEIKTFQNNNGVIKCNDPKSVQYIGKIKLENEE